MKKIDSQKLLDQAKKLESDLDNLTREELEELVTIEMELADRGFDIEKLPEHEERWINS